VLLRKVDGTLKLLTRHLFCTLFFMAWWLPIGHITVAYVLNGIDTLRTIGRTLVWSAHRPQHVVANVKSLVANDETRFKVLTLKGLLEISKVSRQPIGKRETKFKSRKKEERETVTSYGRQGSVAVQTG